MSKIPVTQDYKITIVVNPEESFEILFALREQARLYRSYVENDQKHGRSSQAYDLNELAKVQRVIAIVEKARA